MGTEVSLSGQNKVLNQILPKSQGDKATYDTLWCIVIALFFVICIEYFRSREEIEQWQERQNQVKAEEKRQGEKEVPFSEVTPTAISSSSTISLLKKDIIGGLQPRKLWTSMASHLVRVGYQNQSFLLGVLLFVKYSKHIVIH